MTTPTGYDFSSVHAAMQRYVDGDILAGVSSAVLVGQDLVDIHCAGWADKENQIPMRADHIFRVYSNSKLITSCAVLLLWEEGRFELDEPVERFIPQLGKRLVLKPGATELNDVEPAEGSITIRHLLTHQSGLSYGLLDPGTLIYKAYSARKLLSPNTTLAEKMDALVDLPLLFHPGKGWEYSFATDVLTHLIEVVSGQRFDAFIQARILGPLGMVDTGLVIPPENQHRLATFYMGADLTKPMLPGLTRNDNAPFPQANLKPFPWQSGGGGLVSTLPDTLALLRSLMPGGPALLKPDTIAMMMRNQLPDQRWIKFPRFGELPGKGFGMGGAVTLAPLPFDPPESIDEFQWGGLGGTHWWISPRHNMAGVLMTQRHMAFWHPFSFEFKQGVYQAVLKGR
ncbi:MAG TPA: serine hydrolase domain-containing protein [Aquabacterium sp.]|uniref:serine hydrolase domain-containing protein n=1 Tax=Aquabacterium sp. TaxID=1872578 RepID=UPI002E31E9E8|nr:serine hydrolase domain-containing protein [Aquabacterium sp.]HEX5356349.1 serine hydrolase domain-containing protein [Aquabacterium sp.]